MVEVVALRQVQEDVRGTVRHSSGRSQSKKLRSGTSGKVEATKHHK